MFLEYAYCSSCGSEFIETKLPFVATYANDDFVRCTNCGNEFAAGQTIAAELLPSVAKDVDVDAWQLGVEIQE